MATRTITIDIADGQAVVSTKGFQGKACLDATAELQKAMGVTVKDTKTPEFDVKEVQAAGN